MTTHQEWWEAQQQTPRARRKRGWATVFYVALAIAFLGFGGGSCIVGNPGGGGTDPYDDGGCGTVAVQYC